MPWLNSDAAWTLSSGPATIVDDMQMMPATVVGASSLVAAYDAKNVCQRKKI